MALEEVQNILSGVKTHISMGSADHEDIGDLDRVSIEIKKLVEAAEERGRNSVKQVLLTLQANTAPDAPWADKAVHDFVSAALTAKRLQKSQYLIDIL